MATVYTTVGKGIIPDIIDGSSAVHLDATNAKIAWGTGAGTADVGDTTLFSESADEARAVPVVSQPSADKNQWVATLTCAVSPKTITNAGLFNAASGASLFIKGDFTGIVLAVGDKIEFTITLQQT